MYSIQTLISTRDQHNINFLDNMNIETDVIIGNQNGGQSSMVIPYHGYNVYLFESTERGLAYNRNMTLEKSSADICVIADDDLKYCVGYSRTIESAFEKYSDADVIIFNLRENPIERYVIKKAHRVRGMEFLRYGSVRIAFRRKSVYGKIFFDNRFGAGSDIPIGEDAIFLGDCQKNHLVIYAVPDYILELPQSESSWFHGYNEAYFFNKGKMYYRIFGWYHWIISLQDLLRHYGKYNTISRIVQFKLMIKGARKLKEMS